MAEVVLIDQRAAFLRVAKSQVGYTADAAQNQYVQWYGARSVYTNWSSIFVSWVSSQADTLKAVPKFDDVSIAFQWFKKNALWFNRLSTKVQPGDLVFYDWNMDQKPDSVEIVSVVYMDSITAIAANSAKEQSVDMRSIQKSSKYIMGYVQPRFLYQTQNEELFSQVSAASAQALQYAYRKDLVKLLQKAMNDAYGLTLKINGIWNPRLQAQVRKYILDLGDENVHVKWLQQRLNEHGAKLALHKRFDAQTYAALKAFQRANHLQIDGRLGVETTKMLVR